MTAVLWRCWACGATRSKGEPYATHKPECQIGEEVALLRSIERHPAGKHGHDPEVEPPAWATPEARKAYALDHMDDADDWYDERDIVRDVF